MGSIGDLVTLSGVIIAPSTEFTSDTPTDDVILCSNCTTSASDADANAIIADDILYIIYILIGSLGCPANLLVVVVIMTYPTMRKLQTNMYIVNQSLIDATVAMFLILTTAFQDNGGILVKGKVADETYCRLWLTKMPLWGMLVSSTYNLVALTIERYLAVVHPIWHKLKFGKDKVLVSVAIAWVIGPLFNIAYMHPTAAVLENGACSVYDQYPNQETRRFVGILTIIVQYFAPLGCLAFCYGKMAWVLHKRAEGDKAGDTKGADAKETKKNASMARARRNVIKTLALVAFFFIFCWTWNQIYYLMFNLGYPADFTSTFYHFTVVMVFCNCCINPFIYVIKYEQFKKGLKRLFCPGVARVGDTGDSSVTTKTTGGD